MSTSRVVKTFVVTGYAVIVFLLVLLGLQSRVVTEQVDPGVGCVKLMYQFATPQELLDNQAKLQDVLSADEYERLKLDNEMRTVNTYYKFGYARSRVSVVESSEGYVLYHLLNDKIASAQLWVFLYEEDSDGRLTDIREYRLVGEDGTGGI